ncbi:MAG: hypothetical protein AMXMBFR76_00650 [Pseudomonadota bacterium]
MAATPAATGRDPQGGLQCRQTLMSFGDRLVQIPVGDCATQTNIHGGLSDRRGVANDDANIKRIRMIVNRNQMIDATG